MFVSRVLLHVSPLHHQIAQLERQKQEAMSQVEEVRIGGLIDEIDCLLISSVMAMEILRIFTEPLKYCGGLMSGSEGVVFLRISGFNWPWLLGVPGHLLFLNEHIDWMLGFWYGVQYWPWSWLRAFLGQVFNVLYITYSSRGDFRCWHVVDSTSLFIWFKDRKMQSWFSRSDFKIQAWSIHDHMINCHHFVFQEKRKTRKAIDLKKSAEAKLTSEAEK